MANKFRPVIERFFEKIQIDSITGCWNWTGAHLPSGYGIFFMRKVDGKIRYVYVHRFSWEYHHAEQIPEGFEPDHLCRNRQCANPSHIEVVTHKVNMLRGNTIAARNASRTYCPHGHEYNTENTKITKDDSRLCRACGKQFGKNKRPPIKADYTAPQNQPEWSNIHTPCPPAPASSS